MKRATAIQAEQSHGTAAITHATAVGSEEARLRAGLRPPLKLHVQVYRMQTEERNRLASNFWSH